MFIINKDSYNKIAKKFVSARVNFINGYIKSIANITHRDGIILDVGCGGGLISKYLSSKGLKVIGIDISREMLKIAKELNLSNVEFIECDYFEFESNVLFDAIIAYDSFFHIPYEKQSWIYEKAFKLLKNGGYLLFTHGAKDGEVTSEMFGSSFYYSALDKNIVLEKLEKLGFEVITCIEDYLDKDGSRDLLIVARKVFNDN